MQNTVSSYKITKNDEIGITDENDADYDLINVIIVRRGTETSDADIFDYLTAFFASDIDGICKHVNIKDDEEIMEGVKKMSGLGQRIYNQGVLETLFSLVKDGLLELTKAAERANMSVEDFSKLLEEQKK